MKWITILEVILQAITYGIQQNISNPTNRLFLQLVEQERLTLQEHLSSPHPSVFSGVRVTRSLVFCVCFVDSYLSFCTLSFGHCVVCSSSICGFWLPLWYLQALLITMTTRWIMYDITMTTRYFMSEALVDGIILIEMGEEILEEEFGFLSVFEAL